LKEGFIMATTKKTTAKTAPAKTGDNALNGEETV
jgi:hypothetical protein